MGCVPLALNINKQIDRIPIPKKFAEFGSGFARAFRIGCIGLLSLIMLFFLIKVYDILTPAETEPSIPLIRTPKGKKPKVSFNIVPSNVSVRIPEHDKNFITRDGTLGLNILPGNYRVEFNSPQYKPFSYLLKVAEEPISLNLILEPDYVQSRFMTNPGNVDVTATDRFGKHFLWGQVIWRDA